MTSDSDAPVADFVRWKDEPRAEGGASRPEQRVARLIRRAASMTLSEGARQRVRRRVMTLSARRRPPWRVGLVRWSAIALVFFASGVVVAAAGINRTWRFWKVRTPSVEKPPAAASPRGALTREHPRSSIEHGNEAVDPATATPVTAERPPVASRRMAFAKTRPAGESAGAPVPTTPTTSPLSAEADLLKGALVRLRRAQDGEGALADLDAYFARFPNGLLRPEADATRAEALLSLGRDQEALRVLDGLALRPRGREAELRVIRGELRATRDCAGAIADFDETLAAEVPDGLAERALYGRASCRGRSGDRGGARRDLDEYARRFPSGRFAPTVRRARGL